MTSDHGRVAAVHNLGEADAEATLELAHEPVQLFGDATFERANEGGTGEDGLEIDIESSKKQNNNGNEGKGGPPEWRFELGRYGYCWVRVEEGI
jgi:hypothetical protein